MKTADFGLQWGVRKTSFQGFTVNVFLVVFVGWTAHEIKVKKEKNPVPLLNSNFYLTKKFKLLNAENHMHIDVTYQYSLSTLTHKKLPIIM